MSGPTAEALADGAEPLHRQLKDAILHEIRLGAWTAGARIASERELCERFGVSRTTARRAISDLVHAGVLSTVGGKGTFVAGAPLRQELQPLVGFSADLAGQGIDVHAELLDLSRIEADPSLAEALDLRLHAPVVRLRRLRLSGQTPLAVQTSFLPEHLCPGILHMAFDRRSLYETLRDVYGLALVGGSTVIQAGVADAEEARLLRLAPGGPILRTFQTTHIAGGAVVERCEASFPGERFQLTVGAASGMSTVYATTGGH